MGTKDRRRCSIGGAVVKRPAHGKRWWGGGGAAKKKNGVAVEVPRIPGSDNKGLAGVPRELMKYSKKPSPSIEPEVARSLSLGVESDLFWPIAHRSDNSRKRGRWSSGEYSVKE